MGCSGSKSTGTSSGNQGTQNGHVQPTSATTGNGETSEGKSGNVYVTVEEAVEYVEGELGLSRDRAERLVARVNKTDDGKVANDELVNLWTDLNQRKKAIKADFQTFDKDNTGRVTKDEAVEVLTKRSGGKIKKEDLERMMSYYDKDNNGQIDYDEFTYFYSALGYRRKEFAAHWFKELDKDGSGDLDPSEMKQWLKDECLMDEQQACSLACSFDANQDHRLDKQEFKNFFEHLFSEEEKDA